MASPLADAVVARLRVVESHIAAGRIDEAASALGQLAAAAPRDPRVHLTGAALARAMSLARQELAALQQAVAVAPNWPPAHIELAKAYSRNGRHAEALATIDQAARLAPRDIGVLELAVGIAGAASDTAATQRHLQAALALRPADPSIHRSLAICFSDQHRHAEAEAHWRAVIAREPDDVLGLGGLGTCLISLKRNEEAQAVLQRALAVAPGHPTLQFHLAVARGETPKSQPPEISEALFDEYAGRFDKHLVGELKYRVPRRVAEFIRERHPGLDVSVLDLGCGTGLLGVYLGRIGGALVGVDVSSRMLDEAARHGIYSELRHADLDSALREFAPASFDYVTANDVFVYVGDLSGIIPAIRTALRPGGELIFSCETATEAEGDLALRPTRRYAHSRASVERLCAQAGFARCTIEAIDLRFDGGEKPIPGFIAFAQRGAA